VVNSAATADETNSTIESSHTRAGTAMRTSPTVSAVLQESITSAMVALLRRRISLAAPSQTTDAPLDQNVVKDVLVILERSSSSSDSSKSGGCCSYNPIVARDAICMLGILLTGHPTITLTDTHTTSIQDHPNNHSKQSVETILDQVCRALLSAAANAASAAAVNTTEASVVPRTTARATPRTGGATMIIAEVLDVLMDLYSHFEPNDDDDDDDDSADHREGHRRWSGVDRLFDELHIGHAMRQHTRLLLPVALRLPSVSPHAATTAAAAADGTDDDDDDNDDTCGPQHQWAETMANARRFVQYLSQKKQSQHRKN
jgi:hypothetical protein